uniref:Ig-like domain-containing protein n=1 Tax=Sparus aurata TaxID=8175 RepID=A0A671UV71_SPAAU
MHVFIWFGFWLFSLYSLPVTTGQSNLICSTQPIVAHAGDDVILSCRLDPPISASSRTVEWTKPGLDPEYIHVHQDGRLVYQSQNPLYNYRTALFVDQLINGNVSMKIFRVKTSDAGKYKCFLPSLWKETFIELKIEGDFMDPSSCTPCVAISVLLGVLFILTVVLWVWKWRQSKTGERKHLLNLFSNDFLSIILIVMTTNRDDHHKRE